MRKKLPIIAVPILFFGIVAVALIYMFFNNPLPREYYIFENLEECENLISTDSENESFSKYNLPSDDKDLDNLSYNKFWGGEFKSDSLEYEIFAYEFEDNDLALKYYANVIGGGKNIDLSYQEKHNGLFLASSGITSYELVVISQNRAYKLIAPTRYIDEVSELLCKTFSQKIE